MVQLGYNDVDLFKTMVKNHICIEKIGNIVKMKVDGDGKSEIFKWESKMFKSIDCGRLGFRHMAGRSSLYKNIVISELEK